MSIREAVLPSGWHPGDKSGVEAFLEGFDKTGSAYAVVAPHASWHYSGTSAALSVSALNRNAGTVVVIGGHLSPKSPFLVAEEDGFRTPLGIMETDKELRDALTAKINWRPDRCRDNTVEVLLPMVHYFFPKARVLWTRFPADLSAYSVGKELAKTADALGKHITVIGSADLTHYGDKFGFSPMGTGTGALKWVREKNDADFIGTVLSGDPKKVLEHAMQNESCCSAGAVLGAMGFASFKGTGQAKLLDYCTSADVEQNNTPNSFVGYAGIIIC